MLTPILLTILWTVLSTPIVWPWFWKGVINNKELDKSNKIAMIIETIVFGSVTILFSMNAYFGQYERYNIYGSIVIIIWILIIQIFHVSVDSIIIEIPNKKRKQGILIAIVIILIAFAIIDKKTAKSVDGLEYNEDTIIEISEETKVNNSISFKFSSPNIEQQIEKASDLFSGNSKKRFIIQDESECKIIIFNTEADESIRSIECNYGFGISRKLREQYPTDIIRKVDVVITDDDVPYGKYVILDRTGFLGKCVIGKYVLQNMLTGEITEYTVEQLPEFAR